MNPPDTKMNAKAEASNAWSAIILAGVVVLVAIFMVEFGLQTLVWIGAHHWASANPSLLAVPERLDTTPPAAGSELAPSAKSAKPALAKAYNFQFTAPWTGASKAVPGSGFTQFRFASGQVIIFFDPDSQVDTLREMKSANSPAYQRLTDESAGAPIDSNYALYQAVYAASPAQTSPLIHSANSVRLDELLLLKLEFGVDAPGNLHSFDFGKNRGLEFGDPANGKPAALRLFDDSDKQYRLIFTLAAGSSGTITQDDINAVARSFAPTPLLER